jgi:hypothetical protein
MLGGFHDLVGVTPLCNIFDNLDEPIQLFQRFLPERSDLDDRLSGWPENHHVDHVSRNPGGDKPVGRQR